MVEIAPRKIAGINVMIKRNMLGFVRKITAPYPVLERTGLAQPTASPESMTMDEYEHCKGKIAPRKSAGTGSSSFGSEKNLGFIERSSSPKTGGDSARTINLFDFTNHG
jgi:hypothetical protein